MLSVDDIEKIIEAALFASEHPLSKKQLKSLVFTEHTLPKNAISVAIEQLIIRYQGRGVELVKVASGYRFQTNDEFHQVLAGLTKSKPAKISQAMLETLSLVAYKQPITRAEIEEIRGVSVSSYIIKSLIERRWVKISGHKEVPGRPVIYATTNEFLDYFGLSSLAQLPKVLPSNVPDENAEQMSIKSSVK